MNDTFTVQIYPDLRRYIARVLLSRGTTGRDIQDHLDHVLGIAWHLWTGNPDSRIEVIGLTACRYFWVGRDIPGLPTHQGATDALKNARRKGDLTWLRCRQLRPDQQASLNEEVARLFGVALTDAERTVLEMLQDGYGKCHIADHLGCNECTIYEIVKRIRKRLS